MYTYFNVGETQLNESYLKLNKSLLHFFSEFKCKKALTLTGSWYVAPTIDGLKIATGKKPAVSLTKDSAIDLVYV